MTGKRFPFTAKELACILTGTAILTFGLFNVHSQSRITEGGVLGATLLVQYWTGITPAITGFVLDLSGYLLGLRYLGWGFLLRSLVASGCFSVFYRLWERIGYLLPDMTALPLPAALIGGCLIGLGVGLVVRTGSAAGGDDAIALVISKVTGWQISRAYLFTDFLVLGLSVSYIPLPSILCSLVTVTLSSFIIEKIQKLPVR
jgi:uncharacterized membrane-anchored protein YitT (DUF2179 family)